MNFDLDRDQAKLKETVRRFAETEVAPGAADRDARSAFPHDLIPKIAALKLTGLTIPVDLGGAGKSQVSAAVVIEELARVDGAFALTVASHNALCSRHILTFGSDAQKKRFVPRLARGEALGAWALTEPEAGSDTRSIKTTARREGGDWILNGSKMFITQGTVAGIYVVMARTGELPGEISAFIVERGATGLSASAPADKFGVRASDTADLTFDHVSVPGENLIGELNNGLDQALAILQGGRIGIGAMAVGLAQGAYDAAVRFAKDRVQFGGPIASKGAIQAMVAEMATEIEQARLLVHYAAWLSDEGRAYGAEASMAKLYASEVASRTANRSLQIHGGRGFRKTTGIDRILRDAKLCEIGEGTSEIQRLIIARSVLKGP